MASIKLSASKFHSILEALPEIIEDMNGGPTSTKLHAAILTEIWQTMSKKALERKPEYSLKLSKPQQLAMVLAVELGLFDANQYLNITMGMLMLEIHHGV